MNCMYIIYVKDSCIYYPLMYNYLCTIFQLYSKDSSALYCSIEHFIYLICVNKDYYNYNILFAQCKFTDVDKNILITRK